MVAKYTGWTTLIRYGVEVSPCGNRKTTNSNNIELNCYEKILVQYVRIFSHNGCLQRLATACTAATVLFPVVVGGKLGLYR